MVGTKVETTVASKVETMVFLTAALKAVYLVVCLVDQRVGVTAVS